MTRRARMLARPAAVVALVLLVLGSAATGISPGSAASATPTPAAPATTTAPSPHLGLQSQTPWVDPTGDWVAVVRVAHAPVGAVLDTSIYEAVATRQAYRQTLFDIDLGRRLGHLPPIPVDVQPLQVDGTRLVAVSIPVRNAGAAPAGGITLSSFGVNPVEVVLRDPAGQALTHLVTHLVRLPDAGSPTKPLMASLILPITAPPILGPLGHYAVKPTALVELHDLGQSLAAHPLVPLTVVPTAETLDGLAGAASSAATDLLALLRQATATGRQVLASFYVTLDQPAWVASPALRGELARQHAQSIAGISDQLSLAPSTEVAVAAPGATTLALASLHALGAGKLVVPEVALAAPTRRSANATLTQAFRIDAGGQTLPAVMADAGLTSAFTRTPSDPTLGAHQLLAELAVLYGEYPRGGHGVVLLPPPATVVPGVFLQPLLEGLQSGGAIVQPVTIGQLFDRLPFADRDGGSSTNGARLERELLPASPSGLGVFPARLAHARGLLSSYESLLGKSTTDTADLDNRLLVAGSSDNTPADRTARVDVVSAVAGKRLQSIIAPANQTVTLTAADGKLPLIIQNNLNDPVTVELQLTANKRLEFPELTGTRHPPCNLPGPTLRCILAANSRVRIPLQVHTKGSGITPLIVTVRAPDSRVLATTKYTVQSTVVSGVGLFITIGAALFLVLWWARHWRRDRRERAEATRKAEVGEAILETEVGVGAPT